MPKIIIVSGRKNSGKTAYLEFLIKRARKKGLQVAGFLSRAEFRQQEKSDYYLEDIKSGRKFLLASTIPQNSLPISYSQYFFDPVVFAVGNRILLENFTADMLVLDEFGPLEQNGLGFRPAFDQLLRNYQKTLVVTIRPSLLHNFLGICQHN